MELTTIVGACGSMLAFLLFVPQARHTWVNRHRPERLEGIGVLGEVCVIANALVWGIYGVLTDAIWTGAPGLINAPLAASTIVLILRRRSHRGSQETCWACEDEIDHGVFITASPGWGSVMPCSAVTRKAGVLVLSTEEALTLREERHGPGHASQPNST